MVLAVVKYGVDGRSRVIGMNMYYFNARDILENTVHGAFVGVSESMAGRGVATTLRKVAMQHFARNGIYGISSRISLDNKASLHSAKKLGYQPVEQYFDPDTNTERYYLVWRFEDLRQAGKSE